MFEEFQFTHPVWGATTTTTASKSRITGFNSRTPCGVRPCSVAKLALCSDVSIHAPRVGCDEPKNGFCQFSDMFQFTHPVWGATKDDSPMCARIDVSIHAPRVGCDFDKALKELARYGFNSRTPCGVRHIITITILVIPRFQFTHPVWGATLMLVRISNTSVCFNSRTPCGVRR